MKAIPLLPALLLSACGVLHPPPPWPDREAENASRERSIEEKISTYVSCMDAAADFYAKTQATPTEASVAAQNQCSPQFEAFAAEQRAHMQAIAAPANRARAYDVGEDSIARIKQRGMDRALARVIDARYAPPIRRD